MIPTTTDTTAGALRGFDDVIDVRSPAEFAEDHAPGAINLPVLENDERARVGTIYVQESRFLARRVGAAIVAGNIGRHLDEALKDKPGSWAPLVYCWRGGQRSNAMATVLAQVGWRPTLLTGGYMTYRRRVTAALYEAEPAFQAILLDGYTGLAKTEILNRLAGLGVQTLDLEGLAAHRGSLFGGLPGTPQPAQKMFESKLLSQIETLDPGRPVVIEAESSKVGNLNVPPMVWKAMRGAARIELSAPREARALYLTQAYGDIIADPAALDATLARLPRHHGKARLSEWRQMASEKDFTGLAAGLIEHHYDPAYERSRGLECRAPIRRIELESLAPDSLLAAAAAIADSLKAWRPEC